MSFLSRRMLPVFALVAMTSAAWAQAVDQDHEAHHPEGQDTSAPQAAPVPAQTQPGSMVGMGAMMPMMGRQDGRPGMMGGMAQMPMMMGQQQGPGGMGLPYEHVEGRIAFLRAELGITDAQAPQWDAFAEALRANARALRRAHEAMGKGSVPSSLPERLSAQQEMVAMRLDVLRTLEAAAGPLYAAMTEEQRKLADRLLAGPMGMM
jgi:hypothetical protein